MRILKRIQQWTVMWSFLAFVSRSGLVCVANLANAPDESGRASEV
jgi:hypothetical protein